MSTTTHLAVDKVAPQLGLLKQMKIDVDAYHGVEVDQIYRNPDLYCGATIFSEQDTNPIVDASVWTMAELSDDKDAEGIRAKNLGGSSSQVKR